jgi:hypothetical protein
VLDTHEAAAAYTDRVHFVTAFSDVYQDTGFQDFMIFPLAKILLDNRREKFSEIPGTYICDSIL